MRFRSKIFAVLTVVGLLPVALLGWLSFSVNRDELERTAVPRLEPHLREGADRGPGLGRGGDQRELGQQKGLMDKEAHQSSPSGGKSSS